MLSQFSLEAVQSATLAVHIVAGAAALLAGLVALATAKGDSRHRQAGRMYVYGMGVVVVTAVPLAIFAANALLFAIAVFSGYLVFAGFRALSRRRMPSGDVALVDVAGHVTMLVVGTGMILMGGWRIATGHVGLNPAAMVFGAIGASLAVRELRECYRPPADQMTWLYRHLVFMGAAYIATVTAAITVNLTAIPPLARWLGPTIVGSPLIAIAVARYRRAYAIDESPPVADVVAGES